MSIVDYSERDADGNILGPPRRVMVVDENPGRMAITAAAVLAMSGVSCIPLHAHGGQRSQVSAPPQHTRHQGHKERMRRLKNRG